MKIFIGADHHGVLLKKLLIETFADHEWTDVGTDQTGVRVDYPEYAAAVVSAMQQGQADRGVLICGSGVGMAIAANRHKNIYAALCWNEAIADQARRHDGCNLLVLAADHTTPEEAVRIVSTWLRSPFLEGRYKKRLEMVDEQSS